MAKTTCKTCRGKSTKAGEPIVHLKGCPEAPPETVAPDADRCEFVSEDDDGGRCIRQTGHDGDHEPEYVEPGSKKERPEGNVRALRATVDGKEAVVLQGDGKVAQEELELESLEDIVDAITVEQQRLKEQESVCASENDARKKLKDNIDAMIDRLVRVRDKQKHPERQLAMDADTEQPAEPDY